MLLQPKTHPITEEQPVNGVKSIYAGLVQVEKKFVEIDQQTSATIKLSNEQWQALIALHYTLLHEHHDFFLASQYPFFIAHFTTFSYEIRHSSTDTET